jgi:hypothetical protein
MILLMVPFILPGIMLPVFLVGAAAFGKKTGYLLGFAFYWGVWCIGASLVILGMGNFAAVWHERSPLFACQNWLPVELFVVITLVMVGACMALNSSARRSS